MKISILMGVVAVLFTGLAHANIHEIGRQLALTHLGEELFYSTQPEILNQRSELLKLCKKQQESEHTKLLGCYISGVNKMYLLESRKTNLAGVLESTAAHELLHAFYSSLNSQEKIRLHQLIDQALTSKKRQQIENLISHYHFNSEQQKYNELHSFIGTDLEVLPQELEQHYAQIFQDRRRIIQFSKNTDNEITLRKNAIAEYDSAIEKIQIEIDHLQQEIMALIKQIEDQKSELEALKRIQAIQAHNELVARINIQVNEVSKLNNKRNELIMVFNQSINERNQLAKETNEIAQAMNNL
jgi:hypothetical protein